MDEVRAVLRHRAWLTAAGASAWAAVCLALSLQASGWGALAWTAWVPLALCSDRMAPDRVFAAAWAAWSLGGVWAFRWALQHPMGQPSVAAGVALVGCGALLALPWYGAARMRRRLGFGGHLVLVGAGSLAVEALLRYGPWALPGVLMGHTQPVAGVGGVLAPWGGVPLVSAWVWGLNGGLAYAARAQTWTAGVALGAWLLVPFACVGAAAAPISAGALHMRVVQPALPATQWADGSPRERLRTLKRLTLHAGTTPGTRPDAVVWPETALPPNDSLRAAVFAWAAAQNIPLLTGAITSSDTGEQQYRNQALWMTGPAPPASYTKRHLVPFVEQVPLASVWPALAQWNLPAGGVAGYVRGAGPRSFRIDGARVGPLICFEVLFGAYLRRYVRREQARAFVTVAQMGWWPLRGTRHLQRLAALRAHAVGRAVLLADVRGPSGVIDPYGPDPRLAPAAARGEVVALPLYTHRTPFVRWGDWSTVGAGALLLVLLVRLIVETRRSTAIL